MKYTVFGFNQKKLVDMGLSLTDAAILRWFSDFHVSGKMKSVVIGSTTYAWVSYQSVIDEYPIAGFKSRESVARSFKKIEEAGLLTKHIAYELNGKRGTYTCFAATEEFGKLLSEAKSREEQKQQGVDENTRGGRTENEGGSYSERPKDPSTIDPSTRTPREESRKENRSRKRPIVNDLGYERGTVEEYERLIKSYGKAVVDDYHQRVLDHEQSKWGRRYYKSLPATIRNWLKRNNVKSKEEEWKDYEEQPDGTWIYTGQL